MRDNDIDSLNAHLLRVENISAKPVVWNDRVCIFLRWFNELLKCRFRFFFVCLKQLLERHMSKTCFACIFKHSATQSDVIICVNEDGKVKDFSQLLITED